MMRPCADRLYGHQQNDRFLRVSSRIIAALLSCTLLTAPVWAASSSLGTVVYADRGPRLALGRHPWCHNFGATDSAPNNPEASEVRAEAARLLLSSASTPISQDDASPSPTLTSAQPLFRPPIRTLLPCHLASAVIRPSTNRPTIGQVTVLNPGIDRQGTRGSLEYQRRR